MSHPYRDPALKPSASKSGRLKAAAKVFAIAGSLWAAYECTLRSREVAAELRADPRYAIASSLDQAERDIESARLALVHTPGLSAIVCSGEGACVPIITPDTYPDTARAGELLERAGRAVPEISANLSEIRSRLPESARAGEDIRACSQLRDELGEVKESLSASRSGAIGKMENARNLFSFGAVSSAAMMVALLASFRKKAQESEDSS